MAAVVVVAAGFGSYKFLTRNSAQQLGSASGLSGGNTSAAAPAVADRPLDPALELSPGAAAGYNLLLITLDTTRADHVGCYGATAGQSPTIDALAAGGTRFADAVTVVPMTLPAHTSILTGDYPPTHGVRDNGTYRLLPQYQTLATDLKAAGYDTAAFIGAFVLDGRYGLNRGFDVYDDTITGGGGPERLNPQRPGDVVADSALRWLDDQHEHRAGQPFFAWVHFFDPHLPYDPPQPFKSRYAGQPYDGEIAFMDQQVGRVIEKVRALGLLDKTLVVLVGDHGEGLRDHGEGSHSLLIYAEAIDVPLVFYAPGLIPAGQVVSDRVVATVDLRPTILDLLGLPEGKCDGLSLLRPTHTDRAIYVETLAPQLNHGWSPLFALRRHEDKYIEAPRPEYFDLRSDPREFSNRWGSDPRGPALAERLAALKNTLSAGGAGGAAALKMDAAARRKLESLGYIGSTSGSTEGPLPDPKEMIARTDAQMARVSALVASGRGRELVPEIRQLVSIMPGDASVWSLLTVAQTQAGLVDDAIASRLKLLDLQPADATSWVALASLQAAKGDTEGMKVSLAEAERLEPELGSIYMMRARQCQHEGRLEEALALCAEALRRDPRFSLDSWMLQAELYDSLGKAAEAQAARQHAKELRMPQSPPGGAQTDGG